MNALYLTNGRVVTPRGEADCLSFRAGRIAGEDSPQGRAHDLEGDFLIPGLVELHTDNLERHFTPRAGVSWPFGLSAVAAHDVHMVGSGVTTVFDAITAGEPENRKNRNDIFTVSLEALAAAAERNLLRAEHFLHLRCELAGDDLVERISPYLRRRELRLVSVMDHTPGQRQWRDLDKYKTYHNLHGESEGELEARVTRLRYMQMKNARRNLLEIAELCRSLSLPLASHDDTTEEHVRENAGCGAGIAEFPTTLEAAREAKKRGLAVVMGAPNLVRGGSHSGNMPAAEAALNGLLDILSSDYMPASLLHAAFMLTELAGIPLREALAPVTVNPARAVGLDDRGALEPGKRADAVQVRLVDGIPIVRAVWRSGRRVL
jgi:alpha-D-ribose 1-methylphosphonate 5-triphosphate diphosphatase